MNTNLAHRIHVCRPSSPTASWEVVVAGECHAAFLGENARGRALECALRLAEELRASGAVLVVVDPVENDGPTSRVLRSRMAAA